MAEKPQRKTTGPKPKGVRKPASPLDGARKLTPERQRLLCEYLARGNAITAAAAMAGIDVSSFYVWAKRGRREMDRIAKNPDSPPRREEVRYVRFWCAVDEAMAKAEARYLQALADAAEGNVELLETTVFLDEAGDPVRQTSKRSRMRPQWQAAAWWLQHWAPHARAAKSLRLTGVNDDEVKFSQELDLTKLRDEELAQLEALLEKCTANDTTAGGADPQS